VGALLHDIGKLSLPEELRTFRLTAQDRGDPAWQQHTEAGRKMVKGGLDPTSSKIVLDHHQHFDGSGFPPRKAVPGLPDQIVPLQKKEIHIFCRIATLADRFENFRHLPDGRIAPTVVALKRIRNPGYAKWFDPVVFQAFLESVPPFVPGEQVLLSDGQNVVVTEINEKFPHRPVVKPIDLDLAAAPDKHNLTEEQEEENDIDLAVRNDLNIAQVGDFDVTPYLK
jgi:HD-GYP domain-containing protein (c-di-GMP phosphodiesterase class II)